MFSTKSWDPDLLTQVETLEWRSKFLVEGFLQGLHRSPLRGFSSEFAQYHSYIPGDDLRHLDWGAFARLDRLYVREFEAETNLRCHFLADASGSMAYRSEAAPCRKYDYAALLIAALIRLLHMQRDACGLSLSRSKLEDYLRPRLGRAHFFHCLGILETAPLQGACHLADCLDQLAELFPRCGLVAIFSDVWCDLKPLMAALQHLRSQRHEVCLFQIVDPRELDFQFSQSRLFEDMESGLRIPVALGWNRTHYLRELEKHQKTLHQLCRDWGVTHQVFSTDRSPFVALAAFLAERESRP
ncbi:MAG: DUF58 domain-containing protein [Verrucomicrobiae bacterium]|nr:DUF58 domain-containing protein [Verrucomicrobiae bacterium]